VTNSTHLKGKNLLSNPLYNKGTAFTYSERKALGLLGLLPPRVSSIEEQVKRRYHNFSSFEKSIDKYHFLSVLQNRNEVLFYRLALEHVEEMLPYIYTPTVGEASICYSQYYAESRGLYLSYKLKGEMEEVFANSPCKNPDVIVVTDGERILGLGDMGVGGMVIPVGKLSLYTLFGGISPYKVLPIFLDVGTNNKDLLADPLYIGEGHERIRGEEYDQFIDQFVSCVKAYFPKALLQWEDFSKEIAYPLEKKYAREVCSFNDDIQGTAGVSLAVILSALEAAKRSIEREPICILGAGSAGMGIANILIDYLESLGVCREKAARLIYIIDSKGLVIKEREGLREDKLPFAKDERDLLGWKVKGGAVTLQEVIENGKITTLIGVSTKKGVFDKKIVKTMLKGTNHPIILPLSNPTSYSEGDPKDLLAWSDGGAMVATGSPFPPVSIGGKMVPIAQCNNAYIFPAIGLAASTVKMHTIEKESFFIAAKVLAAHSPARKNPRDSLLPPLSELRGVIEKMAVEIAKEAVEKGNASKKPADVARAISDAMWYPEYQDLQGKKGK